MEDQGVQILQTILVKNFSFLQLPLKHDSWWVQLSFEYNLVSWIKENKNSNVQYYFKI